jgi:hypothetical protein
MLAAHPPYPAPPDRTARRLEWAHLPPPVRDLIARRCGSEVVDAVSQTSGFTPGFASVLTCADGSRHFVKAASAKAQRMFAESYREEARKLGALPEGVPAPRLQWVHDGDWVVLGIEHVESRQPGRPWTRGDLDATLDALEEAADALTPVPAELDLAPFADDFRPFVAGWEHVRTAQPDLPGLSEAAELAAAFEEVTAGDSLVHTDVRADNVLIDATGKAWLCDWNWPVAGAAWLDSLFALIGPRGDGLDVAPDLGSRRLLVDVPDEAIDVAIALVTGYFLSQADQPVPPTSPWLRDHQRWQGEVCWAWLAERRGWA